ncbi:uncharacterized protein [Atheta coriaria]|uniref:uncharacterized protein n=1 Tax=Dalotia coriaria TaxID=877792 RepID=UPI0031F3F88B
MKAFLVAALFIQCALFVSCDFNDPKWKALRAKCVGLTGMDETHIHNAKQGQFTVDETFKMYLKCIMDEENLWLPGGKVNVEALMEAIPEKLLPIFEKPVKECIDEVEHDPEQHELAYKLTKCVYDKTLDHNLIKLVTLFCCLLAANSWKNVPEEFMEIGNVVSEKCIGKVPVSKETVAKARDLIFPETGTEEENHYKCYLLCIFQELGVWGDGVVDVVKHEMAFPPHLREKYNSSRMSCKGTKGANDCESAFLTMECYKNHDPDNYFIF